MLCNLLIGLCIHGERNKQSQDLMEMVELAEKYALTEANSWFETKTIERNMTELKKYADAFSKIAADIEPKQKQMEALFEDAGKILNRYFDIKEIQDAVPTTKSVNKADAPLVDPITTIR